MVCPAVSEGRERRFGSFPNKTKAREFYEKAKLEQKEGRFFPERYQYGGYELFQAVVDRYLLTITAKKPKGQIEERYFGDWWKRYFEGRRLNTVTVHTLEDARQKLLKTVVMEGGARRAGSIHDASTRESVHGLVAPCPEWGGERRQATCQSCA